MSEGGRARTNSEVTLRTLKSRYLSKEEHREEGGVTGGREGSGRDGKGDGGEGRSEGGAGGKGKGGGDKEGGAGCKSII